MPTIAPSRLRRVTVPVVLALLLAALLLSGCGGSLAASTGASANGKIAAVAAENQYANVIEQIGGKYVKVTAIESNPNTDPHTFEASPRSPQAVERGPADRKTASATTRSWKRSSPRRRTRRAR